MSSLTTSSDRSIVSHIRDLLPLSRHALFHVKLVINQLSSVPLMTGQFRVKWKFRNSQAVNSAGRPLGFGRALARKLEKRHSNGKRNAVTAQPEDDGEQESPEQESLTATATEESPTPNGRTPSIHSSGQSSNSKRSAPTPPSDAAAIDYRPDARGYTPFLPLQEFKVAFAQQIDVAVQMSVDRDSSALLQSALKLTVMQRVIPGDPNAPRNPRLGHVEVNLAEYVDAGSVTRNYLLRRSKVNAMLNLTITMTQISGEEQYRAPPLRKEEIGAGIADFLTPSEPLPALCRFDSTEDPWLADALELFVPQQQEDPPPPDPPPEEPPAAPEGKRARWRVARRAKQNDPPPPPTKPVPQKALHPTEALIEAIFNPYPSASPAPSPFTYYVPPSVSDSTDTSRGSFEDSSRQESASEEGWWHRRKMGTPARSNSTRS